MLKGLSSAIAALGVGGGACSSSGQLPCLANGQYTLTLTLQDDAGRAPCDGYAGSTAVVTLANLHYEASHITGSATMNVTRSPGTQPEAWSQCSKSEFISCQQFMVVCTQGANFLEVYLSNLADGPGWAQYEANYASQCFDNYSITVVSRPK